MKMVGNQRPGVTRGIGVGEDITEPFDTPIAITVIGKHRATIDTPGDDVVQRTGRVYAGFAKHSIF